MNIFTITIPDAPAALLITYGAGALIRVQSSPTEGGVYGDVVTIPIVSGTSTYAVYDPTSAFTDWYQIRYEAADGSPAGSYSAAFQPMPVDGIYASLSDFKHYVNAIGADTSDDTVMVMALDASARAIDRAANRTFVAASSTPTARVFTPVRAHGRGVQGWVYLPSYTPTRYDGRYILPVDDLPSTASPTVMFDSTGNGDFDIPCATFRLGPLNASARGLPYTQLIFDIGTAVPFTENSVEVTDTWGWDATPATIANANLLQAARFLKRREAAFGIAGSPDMGNQMRLLAKLDPDVAVMVNTYRKWWGAA